MFTGIVERTATVSAVVEHEGKRRLTLAVRWGDEAIGESIAINGCCLTVAAIDAAHLHFDAVRETLAKTNLGRLVVGDLAHVERSLRPVDRLGGHFVLGHVDGLAEVMDLADSPTGSRLRLRVSEELSRYVIPKGSVCLDGVSLTIASVRDRQFEIALIPTTLERTLLARRPVSYLMNFEADILVKTVVTTLARMTPPGVGRARVAEPA